MRRTSRALFASFGFFAWIYTVNAYAVLPIPELTPLPDSWFRAAFDNRYRIGDDWGKKPITLENLKTESAPFRRAALATAKLGGATSFYLGKFNGHHVMATNHHVLPEAASCLGAPVRFPLTGKSFKCITFYGEWTDVDLALFEIEVKSPDDEAELAPLAQNFAFGSRFYPGQLLVTIGFGIAGNPFQKLVGNQDSDCKVFSQENDFRFMGDPDEFNPGSYETWSFSNGCDVSHGDSGSAMIDRQNGDVLGIIWTGKVPKNTRVQKSTYLDSLLKDQGAEIWTELSFAVPAPKIKEHLTQVIQKGGLSADTEATLRALIGLTN